VLDEVVHQLLTICYTFGWLRNDNINITSVHGIELKLNANIKYFLEYGGQLINYIRRLYPASSRPLWGRKHQATLSTRRRRWLGRHPTGVDLLEPQLATSRPPVNELANNTRLF
jgi:hypothetical protein